MTNNRETITLQTGQCGNQVGQQYWSQLAREHGITLDGSEYTSTHQDDISYRSDHEQPTPSPSIDNRQLYFNVSDKKKYTPRAILIDLEPSVINKCTSAIPMINPRNVHLSEHGSGAANNWMKGYTYGTQHEEDLLELIQREVDKCDNFANFQLMHSVAGGTGSGVGSKLLELLDDNFGSKKLITNFSIFPFNEKTSDVVVQPYNTVLTLSRLIEFSDATFVFHNDALNSIENSFLKSGGNNDDGFNLSNKLISRACASISNPIRFPNYMYSSHEDILSGLIPSRNLKFLTSSLSLQSNLGEYDLILDLNNDKYKMNRVDEKVEYISVYNYIIGNNLNYDEIKKGKVKSQTKLKYVPWSFEGIQTIYCNKSNYEQQDLQGYQLSNNTSIISVFTKILKQYDQLAKREAYINGYVDENTPENRHNVMDMFNECKENVLSVIDEYKESMSAKYLDDEILESDLL